MPEGFEALLWLVVMPCAVVVLGAIYWTGTSSSRALKLFDAAIAGVVLLLAWSIFIHLVASA